MQQSSKQLIPKSCVYWIRAQHHKDVFVDGYVGVASNGLKRRMSLHKHHLSKGSLLPIYIAMRKYQDYVVEVILEADADYCYEMEGKLRSQPNIGWNCAIGGLTSPTLGRKHTEDTKAKIRSANTGRINNLEYKINMSLSTKKESNKASIDSQASSKNVYAWNNSNANTDVWKSADLVYEAIQDYPNAGVRLIGSITNLNHTSIKVVYKKVKTGWNPLMDAEWLIFSSKLRPDTSGDKSIQTGVMPNLN